MKKIIIFILSLSLIGCGESKKIESMDEKLEYYRHGTLFIDRDGYEVKYFYSGGETRYYVTPNTGIMIENKKRSNDD